MVLTRVIRSLRLKYQSVQSIIYESAIKTADTTDESCIQAKFNVMEKSDSLSSIEKHDHNDRISEENS